mmetsp:Transcript_24296/g.79281  ORF Transcript_24296/g.79281 Transcript_24296/m.79281 type:complete len:103 (+) Transcript_24296:2216-2524(+)
MINRPQPTGTFGYVVANHDGQEMRQTDPRAKAGIGVIFKAVQLPDGRNPLMVKSLSPDGPAKVTGKIEVIETPVILVPIWHSDVGAGRRCIAGGGWQESPHD